MVSVISAPENSEPKDSASDRQHGDQRVAKRMAQQHAPLASALGARGADVVLAQRLDHGAAHEARIAADAGRASSVATGSDKMAQRGRARPPSPMVGHAAGRQPAQLHREKRDQHEREPEGRHRDAGEATAD